MAARFPKFASRLLDRRLKALRLPALVLALGLFVTAAALLASATAPTHVMPVVSPPRAKGASEALVGLASLDRLSLDAVVPLLDAKLVARHGAEVVLSTRTQGLADAFVRLSANELHTSIQVRPHSRTCLAMLDIHATLRRAGMEPERVDSVALHPLPQGSTLSTYKVVRTQTPGMLELKYAGACLTSATAYRPK